jgi:hypothetical protein
VKGSLIVDRTVTGFIAYLSVTTLLLFSAMGFTGNAPALAQGAPLNANVQSVSGPENVMILLDSSYSMSENLAGDGPGTFSQNKMGAAKRSVLEMIRDLPPTANVGLRIYGNSNNPMHACHATTNLVPLGQNNRNVMAAQMLGVQPTGSTPISYSIIQSLNNDFQGMPGKRSIILISDGIETCGEDPCTLAVRMQQMGANVKINVIGLGIQDVDAIKQLRCVALATKGRFYTANTAAELGHSLHNAMAVETHVQATILPNGGQGQGQSSSGPAPAVNVPSGNYPPNPSVKSTKPNSNAYQPNEWLNATPAKTSKKRNKSK